MHRFLVSACLAAAVGATSGCATDAAPAQSGSTRGGRTHTDSAGGLIVAPSKPYVESSGGAGGLAVTVGGDSLTPPRADGVCEVMASPAVAAPDVVVWVDGIRQGKALPEERRYELVSAGCELSPRIQAVVVGGAMDVYNDDRVLHKLVFIRAGTNDTLQTMPFTNDNEIVASDRLTRTPGIVEVRCTRHPQERAYIAVFDHPYFGVASGGGTLTLDSMPAGDYTVMTWREGMSAPLSTPTKVGASGQTQVVVK
jgi:hypothetical protein